MKKKIYKHLIYHITLVGTIISVCPLWSSCTEEIYGEASMKPSTEDTDGMGISINVVEQADLLYQLGRTRSDNSQPPFDSLTIAATTSTSRPMEGSTGTPLYLHRKPLPLMGIHRGTVRSKETGTRADASSIIPEGSDDINFHDSLTIWGSVYDPTGGHHRLLFHQTLLKKIRGFRSTVHWPYDNDSCKNHNDCGSWKGKYMNFCALAPAYESLENLTVIEPDEIFSASGMIPPSFDYTVPEDPAQQRDLLFGLSNNINVEAGPSGTEQYPYADTEKEQHLGQDDKVIPLTFYHILTAVRFAQGKMPTNVTITKIQLDDIIDRGVFTPNPDARPGEWAKWDTHKTDYDIKTDYQATKYEGSENTYIDGGQVLFLMPHTLTSAAYLHVTMVDESGEEHILSCNLAGDIWRPGYTLTYVITIGEVANGFYLYVDGHKESQTGDSAEDTPKEETNAVSGSFRIHSYSNFLDYSESEDPTDKNYAADWKVSRFYKVNEEGEIGDALPDNTKPEWLNSITGWTNNAANAPTPTAGGTPATLTYTFDIQSSVYPNGLNHATILKGNKQHQINLSVRKPNGRTENGDAMATSESANCYIVNAVGTYNFPAVYGNSLQGGNDVITTNHLNDNDIFLDHSGRPIKHAYISTQTSYESTDKAGQSTDLTKTATDETNNYSLSIVKEAYSYTNLVPRIVWQDTSNAIVNSVVMNGSNIQFLTVQDQLTPCNIIIGLYGKKQTVTTVQVKNSSNEDVEQRTHPINSDTEELLWTWHIWVTDEVYPNNGETSKDDGITVTSGIKYDDAYPSYNSTNNSKIVPLENKDDNVNNIMPVNLGWVPKDLTWNVYEPREVWIEVEQVDKNNNSTGNKIHLKIRQEAKPDLIEGWSTMYQWGRPTALPLPLTTKSSEIHHLYNSSSTDITADFYDSSTKKISVYVNNTGSSYDESKTVQSAIANPLKMIQTEYTNNGSDIWIPQEVKAYWSTKEKTLYDPCPPGFQMPALSVFSGLSKTGEATNAEGGLNMYWSWGEANLGGYMYTSFHSDFGDSFNRYQPVVYFPATANYKNNGENNTSSSGFYWTGEQTTNGKTCYFRLRPSNTPDGSKNNFETKNDYSGYAMPIRPVVSSSTP